MTSRQPITPAHHIVRQGSGDGFIDDYVHEILTMVDEDVKKAVEEKRDTATTEIPTTFDVPGMINQRAQMYIYFKVLRALKQAQYFPNIRFNGKKNEEQRAFLHVKWFSKEDEEMEKYMDKFIKMHSVDQDPIAGVQQAPLRRRRRAAKK